MILHDASINCDALVGQGYGQGRKPWCSINQGIPGCHAVRSMVRWIHDPYLQVTVGFSAGIGFTVPYAVTTPHVLYLTSPCCEFVAQVVFVTDRTRNHIAEYVQVFVFMPSGLKARLCSVIVYGLDGSPVDIPGILVAFKRETSVAVYESSTWRLHKSTLIVVSYDNHAVFNGDKKAHWKSGLFVCYSCD